MPASGALCPARPSRRLRGLQLQASKEKPPRSKSRGGWIPQCDQASWAILRKLLRDLLTIRATLARRSSHVMAS